MSTQFCIRPRWATATIVLVTAALVAIPSPVHAQSAAPAAEALFNAGREAMEHRDYAAACQKFRESDRLDPALGTKLNLANCEEQRGRLATAWLVFRQVRSQLPADDHRIAVTEERIAQLEQRVPRLRILLDSGAPAATRVRVGDLELTSASFGTAIPVDPGARPIVVILPGSEAQRTTANLEEGETLDLKVPLPQPVVASETRQVGRPEGVKPATADTKPVTRGDDSVLGADRVLVAVLAGGAGAAGLLAGAITGIIGLNDAATGDANCFDATRTCNKKGYDANASARSLAAVSTIGFVVGVVGVGAGAYLFLTAAPRGTANDSAAATSVGVRGAW